MHNTELTFPKQPPCGYMMSGTGHFYKYMNLNNPLTIRAIFPQLMIKLHPNSHEIDELSSTEITQLQQIQVYHLQKGTRFPTATQMMQWFGIEPEVSQAYTKVLPCTLFAKYIEHIQNKKRRVDICHP